jgi:DNA-binding response OmpR family regulator
VLFLSGDSHPQQVAAGLIAGADDYVVKPFRGADLLARVDAALAAAAGRGRRRATLAADAAGRAAHAALQAARVPAPAHPVAESA